MVIDRKGILHIGYESLLGLEHAWWNGKEWSRQLILKTVGTAYFDNSMTIDSSDTLFMTFRDPVDGSLRLAVGRSATATSSPRAGDAAASH